MSARRAMAAIIGDAQDGRQAINTVLRSDGTVRG
jgi:hypothetical protein